MSAIKLSTPSSGSISLSPADTASNLTITVPAVSGTMATLTTPSFATTIGVGGATPAASGAGITFPATQSASSDANTLDDYEEGTWTPTFSSTGATFTQINTNGSYTKVGNVVNLSAYISLSGITGTLTNALFITGLPFASKTGYSNSGAFGVQQFSVVPSLFDDKPSDTKLYVYQQGTVTNMTPASMNTSGFYLFTITYQTN